MEFIAEEGGGDKTMKSVVHQKNILSSVMTKMKKNRENKEETVFRKIDLSGMSLNSLSNPSLNLSLITKLDLSNNNLKTIPESLTARLLNLLELDVHSNQLTSLPNSIGCLSKLQVLNVSANLLKILPKSVDDCKCLEELNANFNRLETISKTMGYELSNLQKLSLNSNKLSFLPQSISHITTLRILDVHLNALQSLPEGLESLIHLKILNISQNFHRLCSIPPSIGLLMSLTELDISYNSISILPNSLGCLGKLKIFHAQGNPLVSPPMEIVEESIEAVRSYLNARMIGEEHEPRNKQSWFGSLIRCNSQSDVMPKMTTLSRNSSIDEKASPRYMSIFSPLRILSPGRTPK
ncbi:Leucine rich repeat protein [Zostera marina]|uniref:Leucine rich repeat protein n=1 Tax=Zostera marina TaxID=29655 RepID=A0A0K9PXJ8_ZOSMR|nr:Leucine rich repeat protein [Zostera marina]